MKLHHHLSTFLKSFLYSMHPQTTCLLRYVDNSSLGLIIDLCFSLLLVNSLGNRSSSTMNVLSKIALVNEIFNLILQLDEFISIMDMIMIEPIVLTLIMGSRWSFHRVRPPRSFSFSIFMRILHLGAKRGVSCWTYQLDPLTLDFNDERSHVSWFDSYLIILGPASSLISHQLLID